MTRPLRNTQELLAGISLGSALGLAATVLNIEDAPDISSLRAVEGVANTNNVGKFLFPTLVDKSGQQYTCNYRLCRVRAGQISSNVQATGVVSKNGTLVELNILGRPIYRTDDFSSRKLTHWLLMAVLLFSSIISGIFYFLRRNKNGN